MYGRAHSDAEAELEGLLRQIDKEVAGALGGGARAGTDSEALALALDGEAMDTDALRQAWSAIPPDLKQALFAIARQYWGVRGAALQRLVTTAYTIITGGGGNVQPLPALQTAAVQLGIPPRRAAKGQKGMSPQQVKDFHRRQQQRSRKPGQNPQTRPRSQRETEAEAEARLLEPWPEYLLDDELPDEADYMSRQRGQGNILTKCQEILTPEQFNHLNNLAVQKANRTGHRGGGGRTRGKHQKGASSNKDRMLRAACRLAVQSGYQAAVDYLAK